MRFSSIVELYDGDTHVFTMSAKNTTADKVARDLLKKRTATHAVVSHFNGIDRITCTPLLEDRVVIRKGE